MATRRKVGRLQVCPVCGESSLFYNERDRALECLNPKCRATGKSLEELEAEALSRRALLRRKLVRFGESFSKIPHRLNRYRTYRPRIKKRHISGLRTIISKTLIAIGLAGVTLIIFTSVSLVITGVVRIAGGVVIGVLGLVLVIWCCRSLSLHSIGVVRSIMISVISAIFLILTSSYLGVGGLADIKESLVSALAMTMN
jgi:hypothetical protein